MRMIRSSLLPDMGSLRSSHMCWRVSFSVLSCCRQGGAVAAASWTGRPRRLPPARGASCPRRQTWGR
eukprot:3188392-Prymnesium_polylepis.1